MPSIHDREKAFEEGPGLKVPYDIWPRDTDHLPPFPFPTFNQDAIFENWKLVKVYPIRNGKPCNNILVLSEQEFIDSITVGMGYAYIEKGRVKDLIGEYRYVNFTS